MVTSLDAVTSGPPGKPASPPGGRAWGRVGEVSTPALQRASVLAPWVLVWVLVVEKNNWASFASETSLLLMKQPEQNSGRRRNQLLLLRNMGCCCKPVLRGASCRGAGWGVGFGPPTVLEELCSYGVTP